jgi:hypothetical protein
MEKIKNKLDQSMRNKKITNIAPNSVCDEKKVAIKTEHARHCLADYYVR